MTYLPIHLGIALRKSDAHFSEGSLTPELKQKIFERDDYTCQCCGFKSTKYQEIHFLNNNHVDFQLDNMVTTCIFCHQCFNLDQVSKMRSGALVWLPEIDQAHLHHIARAIYIARIAQGSIADAAKKCLEAIMARRQDVKARLGSDDPYVLSVVLQDFLTPKTYAMRGKKLDGVRLFPLDRRIIKQGDLEFNQFPQILAYWRSKTGPFGGKIPATWREFYDEILAAA